MSRKAKSPNYVQFSATETAVTFTKDRGELRTNDAGEFFYREMPDGKFTCASPDLERRLIDLGYHAGEQVGIIREPYGRSVIWKVRRIGEPVAEMPRPATTTKKPAARPSAFPECLYASFERAPESTAPRIAATPSPAELNGGSEHATNSVSTTKEPKAPPPITFPECEPINAQPAVNNSRDGQVISSGPADGGLLGRCLCEALDACKVAHAHATEIGLPVTFNSSDVERMAVSIFIERTSRGSVVDRKQNGSAGYVNGHAINHTPMGRA